VRTEDLPIAVSARLRDGMSFASRLEEDLLIYRALFG
jgi:hypothetical protein